MSRNALPHDAFIRKIFSNKKIAIDYFKAYLPNSISQLLDFTTLKREPDTYLSEDLSRSMSDIVYSCERKDGKGVVKICLLIEHKSYRDKYSPIQLGKYIFLGMEAQVQNGEVPSLIVPILLYHGTQRWEYHTVDDLFEDVEDELRSYLPNFEYVFHNLGELDDHELEMLHNKFLAASFMALKYAFNKERLEQKTIRILLLSQSGTKGLRKSLIIYLFSRSEFDDKILDSLPANLKHDVMNTLDIYVEKGIKIGLEKGEKIGLKKGEKRAEESEKKFRIMIENLIRNTDWVDDQIADVTGISIELVREIRTSMKE